MKTTTKVALAATLGLTVVILTGHASHSTKSSVMLSELTHGIADTVGLLLLLVALFLHQRKRENPWVGQVSGILLFLAGAIALGVGIGHFVVLFGGMAIPIKNPGELFLVSSITFVVVFAQIKLTEEVHHMLHGHDHGHLHRSEKASYFFGSNALVPTTTTSKMLKKTSGSARAELFADLIQAGAGIIMGVIALALSNATSIRYLDATITVLLGIWMIYRGISQMADK